MESRPAHSSRVQDLRRSSDVFVPASSVSLNAALHSPRVPGTIGSPSSSASSSATSSAGSRAGRVKARRSMARPATSWRKTVCRRRAESSREAGSAASRCRAIRIWGGDNWEMAPKKYASRPSSASMSARTKSAGGLARRPASASQTGSATDPPGKRSRAPETRKPGDAATNAAGRRDASSVSRAGWPAIHSRVSSSRENRP